MAKPKSEGFPYCQQDTDTFHDPKIRTLISGFGCDGYAVWDYIKQAAYRENGYYVEWNEERQELTAADLYITAEKTGLIVAYLLKRSLLVCKSFNGITVLTSHGIQKRFQEMAKAAKRDFYHFQKDVWILGEEETLCSVFCTNFQNNSGIKGFNSGIKADNSGIIRQKKSKVKNNPLYPPKGEGEEERDRFFSSFPKLKALDRLVPFKPDYSALYERFQKSEFLRTRFSAKWVIENYSDIICGMYDDQARAEEQAREREEWYRARRERAEDVAEFNRKKAEALDGYAEDLKQVKRLEIASAKAEASGTVNDTADISSELSRLREKLKQRLASIGLTEADLLPQYSCKKCNDTGFLPNGKPCNCYREKTR